MKIWAGFKEGEVVEYKKNGCTEIAVVAEGYDKDVEHAHVPISLLTLRGVLVVPADSLDRHGKK